MNTKGIRVVTLSLALAFMAACSSDSITGPGSGLYNLEPGMNTADINPVAGMVKVCTFHDDAEFTITQNPPGGGTLIEATETLGDNLSFLDEVECSIVWKANGALGTFDVTVDQDGPEGFYLFRLAVAYSAAGPPFGFNIEDPTPCDGSSDVPTIATVTVSATNGAVIWFKQCDPVDEPPPGDCNGYTPGYWKNWDNHYTEDEFLSLLEGTIADGMTTDEAEAILDFGGKDMVGKIKKFVLANQLTLNLTEAIDEGADLPNPDEAFLTGDCSVFILGEEVELDEALSFALQIIANPDAFSKEFKEAIKNVLDAIANLGA